MRQSEDKIMLASDYQEGAHPSILKRLEEVNFTPMPGYGLDPISISAKEKIRSACGCPEAEVAFLAGGTQTNAVMISALLASWQGVLAADTGHVSVHEAGAIEAGGHKVLTLKEESGKLSAARVKEYLQDFAADANHDHMVAPGMVYISQPTEFGTLYTKDELSALSLVCRQNHLLLYADGARLAYALASPANDVTLRDLAACCDAFYIGGTKCGALIGEAVVIPDPLLVPHLFTIIKQRGALLAKGWLVGIQFDELFRDDLYLKIGASAIRYADMIKQALTLSGIPLYFDSPTNQIFFVLDTDQMKALGKQVEYSFWEKYDENHAVVRLATSWATRDDTVERVIGILKTL